MRFIVIIFAILMGLTLYLQVKLVPSNNEIPLFLKEDIIASSHNSTISVKAHSQFLPTEAQVEIVKKDYSNLWGHLNHLYATNDVEAGKEYYTEDWFKQICKNYNGKIKVNTTRTDVTHELHIQNWSSDGLVYTAIDSNIIFKYYNQNGLLKTTIANIAVILLFQGDHWRLDGIRIINEIPFIPKPKPNTYENCFYFSLPTQQSYP